MIATFPLTGCTLFLTQELAARTAKYASSVHLANTWGT